MVKHEFHRTRSTQAAVTFVKIAADIGHGTGIIVCGSFDQDCNTVRTIAFKQDFFEITLRLIGCPLDSPFYIVFGHVYCLGILDHGP